MKAMSRTATIIGPTDNGKSMSLADFDGLEGSEGYLYELSRGVIRVTDVPNPEHGEIIYIARQALGKYADLRPNVVRWIATGSECKLLIEHTQSERHPDLAIYKTSSPAKDSSVWSIWIPEIVIEVVSAESAHRDYIEKPEDYLRFGVHEYWIIDPIARKVVIHRRFRGQWKTNELLNGIYQTTLLPGFSLDIAAVLNP